MSEIFQGKCTCHNSITLRCYGSVNLTISECPQLGKVQLIVFCGWSNETFDPLILKHFPKLKTLRFEYGTLLNFRRDFPHLKHLKVNIKYKNKDNYTQTENNNIHFIFWDVYMHFTLWNKLCFQQIMREGGNLDNTPLAHVNIFKTGRVVNLESHTLGWRMLTQRMRAASVLVSFRLLASFA